MPTPHKLPIEKIEQYDPVARDNIAHLNSLHLLSIGVVPYPRIVPTFFLETYQVYSAQAPRDIAPMREHVTINTLAEFSPKQAQKVQSNAYLVGNHNFQSFVRSRRQQPTILIANASENLITKLQTENFQYLATSAEVSEVFKTKKAFREALANLSLPHIPHHILTHSDITSLSFESLQQNYYDISVIQRAEKEVGGNEGTFFIRTEADFKHFISRIQEEDPTSTYLVSPFITGDSLSMVGCITSQGVLTGALQLQLIDVPESLHDLPNNGTFYGNDWGYKKWDQETENTAISVVEQIGDELAKDGYRGIFGIDFVLDAKSNTLYPLECNPRITGAMPAHSLMLLANSIPPFEYYHLLALADRDQTFNFAAANNSLKFTAPYSHVSFSPKGLTEMNIKLEAGVYSYNSKENKIRYCRPGVHFLDIQNDNEFLVIDAIPHKGERIAQAVPGFFKLMFSKQIASSSNSIDPDIGHILWSFYEQLANK